MQRLIIDVEDKYINLVTELLSNLKENIIKNIVVEKQEQKRTTISKLERFKELQNIAKVKIDIK